MVAAGWENEVVGAESVGVAVGMQIVIGKVGTGCTLGRGIELRGSKIYCCSIWIKSDMRAVGEA